MSETECDELIHDLMGVSVFGGKRGVSRDTIIGRRLYLRHVIAVECFTMPFCCSCRITPYTLLGHSFISLTHDGFQYPVASFRDTLSSTQTCVFSKAGTVVEARVPATVGDRFEACSASGLQIDAGAGCPPTKSDVPFLFFKGRIFILSHFALSERLDPSRLPLPERVAGRK